MPPSIPLQAAPVPPRSDPAAPTDRTAQTAPAGQVAPVLVALGARGASRHVVVRLSPEELGEVQIRIGRGAGGSAAIEVSAARPETLHALAHDAPLLHRALDQAGVPQEGRLLHFHLAPADAFRPADAGAAPSASWTATGAPGSQSGSLFGGQSGGHPGGDGFGGQPGGQPRPGWAGAQPDPGDPGPAGLAAPGAPPRYGRFRAGIDITA